MNDIKLNGIAATNPSKLERKEPNTAQRLHVQNQTIDKDDVTVSNQLGNMANTMVASTTQPDNSQRILELKQLINNNQYPINLQGISEKLSKSILILNS